MKRNIGAILFSVILISVITFPFLWLLLGSFKTMKELFSVPIRFFPEHISLDKTTLQFLRHSLLDCICITASLLLF